VNASERTIVLATDEIIKAAGWTSEIVRRHEFGHCNGWPADHRGQDNNNAPAATASANGKATAMGPSK
jgi:hypothetical protein